MASTTEQMVDRPSLLLALSEVPRALLELGSVPLAAPVLMNAPRGDGHPVLLLPGFLASDRSMRLLRRYLRDLGYTPYFWDLGRNMGPGAIGQDGQKLIDRLEALYDETGRKVSLIGWSLGGAFARQLARRRPALVRQVISLGSPISGTPKASNAWRAYQRVSGQKRNEVEVKAHMSAARTPPPVPATAIYSRYDGIVPWQNSLEARALTTDNIEVYGSHIGLGANPAVLWAIADRLAQSEKGWQPFDRSGVKAMVYPSSGHQPD